jgi:hypothetical protein
MNGWLSAAAAFAVVSPIAYLLAVWLIGRGATDPGPVSGFLLLVVLEVIAFILLLIGLTMNFM